MQGIHRWALLGVAVLLSILFARDVSAWGDTGHEIVCEMAFQELNPQARAKVIHLLQGDPDFSRFSMACTWPDHPPQRRGEHFVNLPRSATRVGDNPCPLSSTCVVTAIDKDFAVLSQASALEEAQLESLKCLGHWVGDVHQPLHV
jgi:hypothetical protein